MADLPASAARVQAALTAAGSTAQVIEMAETTRTADEAAAACGVSVGQIVKSLVFRGADTSAAILVLASGANRVHEKRLGRALGEKLLRADADFVRAATGYAIGGVPPLGHATAMRVVMDADLAQYATLWAAGGTPRCVFRTDPGELAALTGAVALPIT
jgi:prolyl-tRNA editing enzyme YbaK/EbsC (Cys-tRNA(Pro) deacylase)